jgi:peptidoglycan/xylan/chitin deacetylase (PgdA/CDA1 family)
LVVPYTVVQNDIRFAQAQGYSSPTDFLDTCTRAFEYLWEEGAEAPKMMSIGVHPRWIGQPARTSALKDFLQYALAKGGIWFARRVDIADFWWERFR